MDALSQLFYLHGIGFEYTSYNGEQVVFSKKTRISALQCCDVNPFDESQVAQLNHRLDAQKWLEYLPPVSVVEQASCLLNVRIKEREHHLCLTLNIPCLDIKVSFESLEHYAITGEYYVDNERYIEVALALPFLPIGYHDAYICFGERTIATQIWSVPEQVYQVSKSKKMGVSVQLYTLKNKAGLGIGDFNDLRDLITLCSAHNMDYILLSPLHLLFADNPERASPYNPNNRMLLNPLYIAIELCEEHINNEKLVTLMQNNPYLAQQTASKFIDYTQVSSFKYTLFRALFEQFLSHASTARREQFKQFCALHNEALATLAAKETMFEYYLQWQAHCQLALCQTLCDEKGMAVGLINDLAVGCAKDGDEFKHKQHLFAHGAAIGAPPDPWAQSGQNWGLPAYNPQKIAENKYQFYRDLIRSNMQNVGGLRIDHVMALRRLWWCFVTDSEQDGCYVYYPFEHLLAILKIESHLNCTTVIGEDLGIVPPEVKHVLFQSGIYSNSLFYFEKRADDEFVALSDLPTHSLLMIANHDVPPFFGWWQHDDLTIKLNYQLINELQARAMKLERIEEQQRLLRFINQNSSTYVALSNNAIDVYSALALCLADAPSQLFTLQLDDLDEQQYPVNIPGTDTEYPNWRRLLTHSCKDIFNEHAALLAAIALKRKG